MKSLILIAGATGATGSVATKLLLKKGFPVRAVRYMQITGEQRVEEASTAPGNPFLIQHASAVAEMHARGQTAGTNDVVEKIIGRKPQTVAGFVEKHRADFQ